MAEGYLHVKFRRGAAVRHNAFHNDILNEIKAKSFKIRNAQSPNEKAWRFLVKSQRKQDSQQIRRWKDCIDPGTVDLTPMDVVFEILTRPRSQERTMRCKIGAQRNIVQKEAGQDLCIRRHVESNEQCSFQPPPGQQSRCSGISENG